MKNPKHSHRTHAGLAILLTSLVTSHAVVGQADVSQTSKPAAPATGKPASTVQRIGEVSLSGYQTLTTLVSRDGKSFDADMSGKRVVVTSPRYDLSGQRVQLSFKGGLVRTGTATGGVEVHIRNPEQQQHASLTCSVAHYFGATATEPAHLHLNGPVHAMQYAPQFAEPLDTISETCDVVLLADGGYTISLSNGSATVTPVEPAAKTKK